MKKSKMDKQVQVRMPLEVWEQLQTIASTRAPGTTPALLIRDAIHKTFPLEEIQAERVAESNEREAGKAKQKKPTPPITREKPKHKPLQEGKKAAGG